MPKLIVASKDRAVGICEKISYAQSLYQCQDIVVSLPLTYSFAFINQFVYSGLSSKSLIVSNGISKPNEYLKILQSSKDSMLCLVGSQFNILKKYIGSLVFPNVRIINFAGGKFPQQEVEVIERMFPNAQIFNNYGCTEAVPRLTVTNAKEMKQHNDIGRPLGGIEMALTSDSSLKFISPYQALGRYQFIDGNWVFTEYSGWIETGDTAYKDIDDRFFLIGRKEQRFKRYGEFVNPAIIQNYFSEQLKAEIHYYYDFDPQGEQGMVLILENTLSDINLKVVFKKFVENFGRIMLPLRIEYVNELPKLNNGKVKMITSEILSDLDLEVIWRLQ